MLLLLLLLLLGLLLLLLLLLVTTAAAGQDVLIGVGMVVHTAVAQKVSIGGQLGERCKWGEWLEWRTGRGDI